MGIDNEILKQVAEAIKERLIGYNIEYLESHFREDIILRIRPLKNNHIIPGTIEVMYLGLPKWPDQLLVLFITRPMQDEVSSSGECSIYDPRCIFRIIRQIKKLIRVLEKEGV